MISNDSQQKADPYRVHMRVLGVAVLVVFVMLGRTCIKHGAFKPAENGSHVQGTDFTAYYSAGELARTSGNIYDYASSSTPFRPYIYPPMFAVFPMAPLSLLSHDTACAIFYIFNVLMLGGGLWLLHCGLKQPADPSLFWRRPEVGAFLAVVVSWRYLDDNLKVGNANLYIFFLLAAGLYFLLKDTTAQNPQSEIHRDSVKPNLRRNPQFMSGLSVALATTFKITPGLFGLYFLWSFRRWAMVGGAVGLILFLLIAPALLIGFEKNWGDIKAFALSIREKTSAEEDADPPQKGDVLIGRPKKAPVAGDLPRAVGISLRGTLMKVLSPTQAVKRADFDGKSNINIVNLEPHQAKTIADVLALLLLLVTVAATAPRCAREGVYPPALSWSLVTVAMLLIAPMTRVAHAVVLLLPVTVLIACLQRDVVSGARKTLVGVALGVICFGSILGSADIIGTRGSQYVHAMGLDTASLLLLFVAILLTLYGRTETVVRASRPVVAEQVT